MRSAVPEPAGGGKQGCSDGAGGVTASWEPVGREDDVGGPAGPVPGPLGPVRADVVATCGPRAELAAAGPPGQLPGV
jgi:hypothetical protein